MSAPHASLDAAAAERKARLAKLASLKRKQPGDDRAVSEETTAVYLSGRNYDVETKGPKLGFETVPSAHVDTVEKQADRIAQSTAEQAAKDEAEADKGIDLFKLQPKKPNWDLKRELAERMRPVDVRTQNAIARLVRERIEKAKKEALASKPAATATAARQDEQGEEVGIEGTALPSLETLEAPEVGGGAFHPGWGCDWATDGFPCVALVVLDRSGCQSVAAGACDETAIDGALLASRARCRVRRGGGDGDLLVDIVDTEVPDDTDRDRLPEAGGGDGPDFASATPFFTAVSSGFALVNFGASLGLLNCCVLDGREAYGRSCSEDLHS
ncbi:hypothetical protein DV738_g975, partial [Chaetothyriales sp. CBS 135597]